MEGGSLDLEVRSEAEILRWKRHKSLDLNGGFDPYEKFEDYDGAVRGYCTGDEYCMARQEIQTLLTVTIV